jgi:hypothetical protein
MIRGSHAREKTLTKQPLHGSRTGRVSPKREKAEGTPAEEIIREQPPGRRARAKTQPDGRRGVLVRLRPEAWRALKQIALDEDLTLQAVMEQAANLRLRKARKPPIA